MKSCSKCGSAVPEDASFCSACGAPLTTPDNQPAPPPIPVGTTGGLSSNMAAALSYLGIFVTGIIFLCIDPYKNDGFVRFHAFQSICFSVVIIVLAFIWSSFTMIEAFSWGILSIFSVGWFFIRLAIFIYWIFLMYKAYNNERYMIPFIGEFALKQSQAG